MGIRPILSALLRNRAGAILVALQIAHHAGHRRQRHLRDAAARRARSAAHRASTTRTSSRSSVTGFEKDFDFLGHGARGHGAAAPDARHRRRRADAARCRCRAAAAPRGFYLAARTRRARTSPANYYATDEHGVEDAGRQARPRARTSMPATSIVLRKRTEAGLSAASAIVSQGLATALFPKTERSGQDLLRRPEQTAPHRRRHRAHARFAGWAGTRSIA